MEQQTLLNALRLRYGTSDVTLQSAWNETLATLLAHRSVRTYTSEPLPAGMLELLVAAAQSASSSSNLQAWSVIAVEDQVHKNRLADLAGDQDQIRNCPLFLVWLADTSRLARIAAQRAIPYAGLDYTEMLLLAVIDAALAAQNAVVAAEALGLGTVYIGGIRNRPLEVAAELQLPSRVFPVFGLCVGWPDPSNPVDVKPRLPQQAVLHRERYAVEPQGEAVEHYNTVMATFYDDQRMRGHHDWAHRSAHRVSGPQSLSGRDTIREALRQLGFELL